MLKVILCGERGKNFATILDSHQFKILVPPPSLAPPSLTNPSWTMEEPNQCLPVGGDLFLEEGLLSPRTKPNPSGRTK